MLSWIVYAMATFVVGLFLALIVSFFSGGIAKKAEKPFTQVIICLILTMGGPFAYVEGLTQLYGKPMEHAIKSCFNDSPIDGTFQYYKVTSYSGDKASALVVGLEQMASGMTDRPILQVSLSKEGQKWHADSYHVVYSNRLNRDGLTFPPYQ